MTDPTWISTASGRLLDFAAPTEDMIEPYDIAAGLSRACRFAGQLSGEIEHYSVAQHSLILACLVRRQTTSPDLVAAALLHDAHEAYTGDLITPLKSALPGIEALHARLDRAIADRFGFDADLFADPLIKGLDRALTAREADLFTPANSFSFPSHYYEEASLVHGVDPRPMGATLVRAIFVRAMCAAEWGRLDYFLDPIGGSF